MEYIWLNLVWTGPANFNAYRQIKKLLEYDMIWYEAYDYGLVWEPTVERQKQEYLLTKKIFEIIHNALTRREVTNYNPEMRVDY